ncbi:MAG: flagellar hook-basal body complex protein [Bacillota bacterium]
MIRSLYSGVSGMRNHQIRMDVIGNNIANVNTTGFKSGRVSFQDALSQNMRPGTGSVNPIQVGTGMTISSILNIHTQGALMNTGRQLDLAIQGNGYFTVKDPGSNTNYYTRDGVFYIDKDGFIVNNLGYQLCDNTAAGPIPIQIDVTTNKIQNIGVGLDGTVTGQYDTGDPLTFAGGSTGILGLQYFRNPESLTKAGQNLYTPSNATNTTDQVARPGTGGTGTIAAGYLEMSNVDLTEEFTNMITTQRGYQANARTITVSDSLLEELINLKR